MRKGKNGLNIRESLELWRFEKCKPAEKDLGILRGGFERAI